MGDFEAQFTDQLSEKFAEMAVAQRDKDNDMQKKLAAVKDIEKRLNKLMKEYDFAEMAKQIELKAGSVSYLFRST